VTRRLAVLATILALGCGGHASQTPVPQTLSQALDQFLGAVKANDLTRMGQLWGNEHGPAADWMNANDLRMKLTVIQIYLNHTGYRVVEGPTGPSGNVRTFRVELQHRDCSRVQPIDLMRTRSGGWLVWDVHLEASGNPARPCQGGTGGTRP
jgi:hypothetical protein